MSYSKGPSEPEPEEGDVEFVGDRVVLQESEGVEEQLLDDQIRLSENACYEVPIEENVYGAFLILLMIDKQKSFDTIYFKREQAYQARLDAGQNEGDEDEWHQWAGTTDTPEETAWRDLCGLLGAGATVVASMWMQFMFGYFMLKYIAKDNYDGQIPATVGGAGENIFRDWHNGFKNGNMTEVGEVCGGSIFNFEADKAGDLQDYASHAHLFGMGMSRGLMFGILSIMVWSAVVVENFRKAIDFFFLAILPNRRDTTVFTWDNWRLQAVVGVIAIFRLFVQLLIAYYGVLFLAYTDNLGDFILNSIALEFLYQIPDKMHSAFASSRTKSWVSAAAGSKASTQMFSRDLPAWIKIFNGGLLVFFCAGAVFAFGLYHLIPFSDRLMFEAYGELCYNTATLNTDEALVQVRDEMNKIKGALIVR